MSRFIYIAVVPDAGIYKIGKTDDPKRRLATVRASGSGIIDYDQSWIVSFAVRGMSQAEILAHFALWQYHVPFPGVNSRIGGINEWFAIESLPIALRLFRQLRDLRPDLGMHFWRASAFLHAIEAPIGDPERFAQEVAA